MNRKPSRSLRAVDSKEFRVLTKLQAKEWIQCKCPPAVAYDIYHTVMQYIAGRTTEPRCLSIIDIQHLYSLWTELAMYGVEYEELTDFLQNTIPPRFLAVRRKIAFKKLDAFDNNHWSKVCTFLPI